MLASARRLLFGFTIGERRDCVKSKLQFAQVGLRLVRRSASRLMTISVTVWAKSVQIKIFGSSSPDASSCMLCRSSVEWAPVNSDCGERIRSAGTVMSRNPSKSGNRIG